MVTSAAAASTGTILLAQTSFVTNWNFQMSVFDDPIGLRAVQNALNGRPFGGQSGVWVHDEAAKASNLCLSA